MTSHSVWDDKIQIISQFAHIHLIVFDREMKGWTDKEEHVPV